MRRSFVWLSGVLLAGLLSASASVSTATSGPARAESRPYLNTDQGYGLTLPRGWEADESLLPVRVRFARPGAEIEVFRQQLSIDPMEYIEYSNRSIIRQWNGNQLRRQATQHVTGRKAHVFEWIRPSLPRLAADMRNYAEWDIISDATTVITVLLKATDGAWSDARNEAGAILETWRWETPPSPASGPSRPLTPRAGGGRDWSHLQTRSDLLWRLPAPGQLMWGMFAPHLVMQEPAFDLAGFRRYEAEHLGTKMGLLMSYQTLSRPFQTEIMAETARDGRLMMLTVQSWEPRAQGDHIYDTEMSLTYQILQGKFDDHLREFARAAARFGKPFLFRFDNEMNGDWAAWSAFQFGKDSLLFREAWRYVYQIFQENGADNAVWIWNPHCQSFPDFLWQHHSLYWPGNDRVDIVGLTCYNTADAARGWQSFEAMYRPLYEEYLVWYPGKPFMITEFSSNSTGGDKAQWIRDMFAAIKTMPNIRMAVWWNGKDNVGDYRLSSPPEAVTAFRAGLQSPEFINVVWYDVTGQWSRWWNSVARHQAPVSIEGG